MESKGGSAEAVSLPASEDRECGVEEVFTENSTGDKENVKGKLRTSKTQLNVNGTKEVCLKSSVEQLNIGNSRKGSTATSVFSYSIIPSELVLSDCVNSTQDLSKYQPVKRKRTLTNALPEILASCSATSFHILVGVAFAATASLVRQLEDENSDIKPTESEIGWIASIFVLVVPIGSIFSGMVMEKFGRLNAVRLSIVPTVISCVITSLSRNVYMLIAGRLLMGIGAALGTNPAVVYITEITSPEYRGALVSAGPTLSSLGMLIGYLSGAFLPWRMVSWINIGYSLIPLTLTFIFVVPESPPWLISKERVEQARESLLWLAKREDESLREKIVERKLQELLKDREEKLSTIRGQSLWRRMSGLKRPSGYKPMLIMIALFAFQQYTGVYITTFYAVQFFESAGSAMNPFHASILIGLTRFIMSIVTVFLLKLVGRRPLCITSCIGMSIFMGISGYYTRSAIQTGETSMVPVYSILLYVCFCMFGLLSLPWTMAAEVFPTEIRGLAHGLVIASAHVIMFISLKMYYQMAKFFGGHDYLQWFFSGMSIVALVFVYLFLPETHKLTLFEIENYFLNNTIYVRREKREETGDLFKRERIMSLKNVAIMESLPENNLECDTLVKQSCPVKTFTTLDLSKIDYIDKSAVDLEKVADS